MKIYLLLLAVVLAGCHQRTYSLGEVLDLYESQQSRPLYFKGRGYIARVRFAPADERMLIDVLWEETSIRIRKLPADNPLVAKKFSDGFNADLVIVSCGREFGDEECDVYSPTRQPSRMGPSIETEDEVQLSRFLNEIGTVLSRQ